MKFLTRRLHSEACGYTHLAKLVPFSMAVVFYAPEEWSPETYGF
jgi:hypothetical protein